MRPNRAILVVEDEPLVLDWVVKFLVEFGLKVFSAENGQQALAVLEAHPEIDVMFADVTMPGMDGGQLAETVRASHPDVKVLLTSGKQPPERFRLPDGGVFIPKPYRPQAIADLLSRLLS